MGPCYEEAVRRLPNYCCLISNATVALEMAVRARFRPGSRILVPSFTFKATYLAVRNAGMIPVVTAVNPDTWALDAFEIDGVDGAVVVSPFGHTIDIESYEATDMPIVYDFAGAWGLDYNGPNVAVYSLHATKMIGVGEGAIVRSGDYNLVRDIERLSNFGHTNAKISEIHCAQLLAHLDAGINYERGYPLRGSTLPRDYCSLHVYSFPPTWLYRVLNNPVFEARRYYYPLVEDAYPECEIRHRTPRGHATRSTVALPRDATAEERARVLNTLETLLNDLEP